ncbi:hypothetical protein ACH4F3_37805 [Streptomyces anulatus]
MSDMKLGEEWWRTVRYAIAEGSRTARLIGFLVTLGIVVGALIIISSGFSVTVG